MQNRKRIMEALEKEHVAEDAGTKNYVVETFLDFQMEEGKSVIAQVKDFQKIVHEVQTEGMDVFKQFIVCSTIHRLPSSWKHFGISLKRKKNEMRIEDLIVCRTA